MMRVGRLSSAVTAIIVAVAAVSTPRFAGGADDSPGGDRGRFVGAWRLVWLEEPGPDGTVHRADCTGMFVFTREGRAAVQVAYETPPAAPAAGPVQYATGGYEATFGRYEVDEHTHTFTYHVEGALVRNLVGKDLKRSYELSGSRLIIKSADPAELWRVTWEHY
jgi:hypothetical protein